MNRLSAICFFVVVLVLSGSKVLATAKRGGVKKQPTQPARVRLLLKVTPFERVVIRSPRGVQTYTYRPGRQMIHTLRARINRPNHFYFGEWHVETIPLAFHRETLDYRVKLNFRKIYGAAANLEEQVGTITVTGKLQKLNNRVFNLIASERMFFRDLQGNPKVRVIAGFNPVADKERMTVAKLPTQEK